VKGLFAPKKDDAPGKGGAQGTAANAAGTTTKAAQESTPAQ
jgi:hypothetical protein